jgi:hypothetical protein
MRHLGTYLFGGMAAMATLVGVCLEHTVQGFELISPYFWVIIAGPAYLLFLTSLLLQRRWN